LAPASNPEVENNVPVRLHGKGNVGAKPKAEVIADIIAAIKERRA
jgi:threonyl-tRNA synthetase